MIVRFYLNGIEINPPNNYKELTIQLNYDTDGIQQAVSITDWEFGVMDKANANDGAYMIKQWVNNPQGVQVTEGIPYKILLDNERGGLFVLFDGYLDAWKARYENGKVTAPSVLAGGIDWLNDKADSFSFEYLYSIGFFDKSYFKPVPYCIVKKQDFFEIGMTLVTIFIIIDKIRDQIISISQLVAGASNPLEMSSIPRLVLQIVYLVTLMASLIPLIVRLIVMLVPPIKYHNVMYVKDLFQIACNYLKLEFKSSILLSAPYNKLAIMPEKYNLPQNTGIFAGIEGDLKNNNEREGYFKGVFGDLIRAMKTMFNGKIVIDKGVLYFEPWDFRLGTNGIVIPDTYDNIDTYEFNWDDFNSTMIVSFLTDLQDRHTIQEYLGTSVEVNIVPKIVVNDNMSLMRNSYEARVPFALAKTKTELTVIEKLLSDFLQGIQAVVTVLIDSLNLAIKAINILIKLINDIIKALRTIGIKIKINIQPIKPIPKPSFGNLIKNRIGMMKMETDYVAVPKIFILEEGTNPVNTKLSALNGARVNARYLFENYHYTKSFLSTKGKPNNQFLIKKNDAFPFSSYQYESAINNNSIFTEQGDEGIMNSVEFNPVEQTASALYRVRKTYVTNLKSVIYEPNGQ